MFVHRAWYRAAWSHELGRKPLGRKLLGEHVVLFRDAAGRGHALNAICAHRGANLALGKVVGDCIRCPFHGLLYDASGACVRIPSQPASVPIPKLARVARYETREKQRVLWIWMDPEFAPDHEPPDYPFLEEGSGVRVVLTRSLELQASFLMVMETALEDSHLPFVHPKTFRVPEKTMVPQDLVDEHEDGRGFTARVDPATSWWFDGAEIGDELRAKALAGRKEFRLGGQAYYRDYFLAPGPLVGFATPADDRHTWMAVAFGDGRRGLRAKLQWLFLRAIGFFDRINSEDAFATGKMLLVDAPGNFANPVTTRSDHLLQRFRAIVRARLEAEGREGPPTWTRPTPWRDT